MSPQYLEAGKSLILILQLLLDQLFDQDFELRLFGLGNEGLLQQDLIDQSIYIGSKQDKRWLANKS